MKAKKLLALVLCIVISISPVWIMAEESVEETTQVQSADPILDNGEAAKLLIEQSANLIITNHKDDFTREELYQKTLMGIMEKHPELIEDAYEAMFSDLDKHTEYFTTEEYDYFMEDMSGEVVGIGVMISAIDEGLLITETTYDSPAAEAGIRKGDIIVSVDGTNIVGMPFEKARSLVLGEIGTKVKIGVNREDEYLEFDIPRALVKIEPGSYEVVEGDIGYIELQSFDYSAPTLVNHALDHFADHGVKNIIFDLRYNLGGSVEAFRQVCNNFIPKGPIIHFQYKGEENLDTTYSDCEDAKYSIIVLTNEYTASAAEAFAGAVQDSGIGIVVGDNTYGKGTMQTLVNFRVGGGVKLTVAEYLTRDKRHINDIGIKPDVYAEDKVIRLKKSGFADMDFTTKPKLGDKSQCVLGINQRLNAMGYDVGIPKDEYTQKTHDAVYHLQLTQGLYPYGVCDITTQNKIEEIMQTLEFMSNTSFDTALEIFRSGTINKYKEK